MRNLPKLKLPLLVLILVAFLAIPAAAGATLTYTKGISKSKVYIAENNGKGAKAIGTGRLPPRVATAISQRGTNARSPFSSICTTRSMDA